jgi:hypothetical protein
MAGYINHFQSFIAAKLPTFQDVFTKEEMVDWIRSRENKQPRDIVEHLLKRTTNYELRNNNMPPSKFGDDLFFMTEPNSFRRINQALILPLCTSHLWKSLIQIGL